MRKVEARDTTLSHTQSITYYRQRLSAGAESKETEDMQHEDIRSKSKPLQLYHLKLYNYLH